MVYVGGKKKIVKYICPILQKELDCGNYDYYIEPFAGGGNIIENIKFKKRIYADINKELIAFFKALQDGWEMPDPYSFDREHYNEVKQSWKNQDNKYPDYYYGYMMFIPSYNGIPFGSFCEDQKESKDNSLRKYRQEHYNSVLKQIDKIKDCEFVCSNYEDLNIKNALIYCDPPYKDSKMNYYNTKFDYDKYYEWCREQSKDNKIYMSECEMPDDFNVVWQKEYTRTLAYQKKGVRTIEKLYTI